MENMIYTNGYVNGDGAIEIPGVNLEIGSEGDVAINVHPGSLEVAIFPTDDEDDVFPEDSSEVFLDE